jgi:hypothetical protein
MISDLGGEQGKVFTRGEVRSWFKKNYPKIKDGTIAAHLLRLSVNAPSRVHYNAKHSDDDLFYQLDSGRFRLYSPENDPLPIYEHDDAYGGGKDPDETEPLSGNEFAYEKDLQNYLAKNLDAVEPGLKLFEDDDIKGIEFPAGGRFIDILAVDKNNDLVVIELKVSRGYDRVVGQLMRYMAWIRENQAEDGQSVRGIIVAREIGPDLTLACSELPSVGLFEYELSVRLKRVDG